MLRRSFIATGVGAAVAALALPTIADAATPVTTVPTLLVVVYANGAYPNRPATPAGCVRYIGPTQPATWLVGDEWIQPSS